MINFMRFRKIYLGISLLILVPGIFHLLAYGLKPSIDFTGGTVLEITNSASSAERQKSQISNDNIGTSSSELVGEDGDVEVIKQISSEQLLELSSIQTSGEDAYLLKLKTIDQSQKQVFLASVSASIGNVEEIRFETVGPILGQELLQKTVVAAFIAVLVILVYIGWAFKNIKFGFSAIAALFHDVMIVSGLFAVLGVYYGIEVDVLFVTALLTTMSFSVHDTIVVFDRIRELSKNSSEPFEQIVNQALNETMGRSLNNSWTIVFMLLALFLLGGDTVKWFSFALLIGTISGTYSSPFVATPILFTWSKWRER